MRCFEIISIAFMIGVHIGLTGSIDVKLNTIQHVNLRTKENTHFIIEDIPRSLSFIVFQVHTQHSNVTVSLTEKWTYGKSEWGSHVGIINVLDLKQTKAVFYVKANDASPRGTIAVVLATGYDYSYPIPGGCNMEFPLENDANIFTDLNSYSVDLKFQYAQYDAARAGGSFNCDILSAQKNLSYSIYSYFMPGSELSQEIYLDHVRKMLTVDGVKKYGKEIATISFNKGKTELKVPAFAGIASMYNVIVTQGTGSASKLASYVPVTTYSCASQKTFTKENCLSYNQLTVKIFCTIFGLFGLFFCFFGHRYFQFEMFVFGFLSLGMVSLIILDRYTSMDDTGMLSVVLVAAVLGGVGWFLFWWFYGIPIFAVLIGSLCAGCLLSSLVFSVTPLGTWTVLISKVAFGMAFACGVLIIPLFFIAFTRVLSIISCSFMGSYAAMLILNMWTGGALHYILLNIYRKCVYPDFITAFLFVPMRIQEILLLVVWGILFGMGTTIQMYRERSKPPFPPCPYKTRRSIRSQQLSVVDRPYIHSNQINPSVPNQDAAYGNQVNERTPLIEPINPTN